MKKVIFPNADTKVLALVSSFFSLVITGTVIYRYLEGWSWVDSMYFTVVTMTTVGYGDFTPSSPASRFVTVLFILSGITVFGSALTILGERRLKRKEERFKANRSNNTK